MNNTCDNGVKIRYDSQEQAKFARKRRGLKKRLFAYKCPFCVGWHLTSHKQYEK